MKRIFNFFLKPTGYLIISTKALDKLKTKVSIEPENNTISSRDEVVVSSHEPEELENAALNQQLAVMQEKLDNLYNLVTMGSMSHEELGENTNPTVYMAGALVEKNVSIGDYSYLMQNTVVYRNSTIGKFCSIARDCLIGVGQHPTNWLSTSPFQYDAYIFGKKSNDYDAIYKGVIIGNDVWIGAKVVIQSGVTIGDGAIIGSGAVVTKNVPPYAIVGGVPSKIIRYRFDEKTIADLLDLKWWDIINAEFIEKNEIDFSDIHAAIRKIKDLVA